MNVNNSQLTVSEIKDRIGKHTSIHYLTIYTVMKGVTLANAAYTLNIIFNAGLVKWQLIPFWLASFTAVILTYDATMVGLLIMAWLPRWQDIIFPFILVVIEFLLFSVLQSDLTLKYWPLMVAIFCANASAVLWNVVTQVRVEHYEARLSKLVQEFIRWMKRDRRNSLALAIFWLTIFLIMTKVDFFLKWQWVLGIIAFFQFVMVIREQEYDRKVIVERIKKLSISNR